MSELELESLAIEQISSPEIRDQVLQLTDRINTLADEGHGRIDDLTLAQETAQRTEERLLVSKSIFSARKSGF